MLTLIVLAIAVYMGYIWSGVLILALLFLPLLDKKWNSHIALQFDKGINANIASLVLLVAMIVFSFATDSTDIAIRSLFFAAIPEEWFFRAYLMTRLGKGGRGNVLSSIVFSLIHGITRGWLTGVLVFIPSLLYGWLYQKSRSLYFVIAVHAFSNVLYLFFQRL